MVLLTRIENISENEKEEYNVNENFPDEQLFALHLHDKECPWFSDMANFLACGIKPKFSHTNDAKRFLNES